MTGQKAAVGDIVFYKGEVWLVRGKGARSNMLELGSADPDQVEVVDSFAPLGNLIFFLHGNTLVPNVTDYITFRSVFGLLLGHFTRVLKDFARLDQRARNDPILSTRLLGIAKIADPFVRAGRVQMCHMQIALDILISMQLDVLQQPPDHERA